MSYYNSHWLRPKSNGVWIMIPLVTTTINLNPYPFNEQLLLTLIPPLFATVSSIVLFIVMFRYLPRLMDIVYKRIGKMERDYSCQCERCRAELRTKRRFKIWKKNRRYKKSDYQ